MTTLIPIIDVGTEGLRNIADMALRGGLGWIDITRAPYSADATGATDCAAAIASAIATGARRIYFPAGTYKVTAETVLLSRNSVEIFGDGQSATTIMYTGSVDATKAVFRLTNSSYCVIRDMTLDCKPSGTSLCGHGVYITSAGSALTQYNACRRVRAQNFLDSAFQIGNVSSDSDTNVDGNRIDECFSATSKVGVRVNNSNANMTWITGGAIASNTESGVEIGLGARGVTIDNVLMYLNGDQHFMIRRQNSGPISIRNIVCELYSESFLRAEAVSGGAVDFNLLTLESINCTCNYTDSSIPLIDYQGAGSVAMRNTRWGGGASTSGGAGAKLTFRPANGPQSGAQWLITEETSLYDGAQFDVETAQELAVFKWLETATTTVPVPGTSEYAASGSIVEFHPGIDIRVHRLVPLTLPTGITLTNSGHLGRQTAKLTIGYAAFKTAGLSQQIAIATISNRTRLIAVYADTTVAYAGLAGTIQLSIDTNTGAGSCLAAHDVKTAAVTKGLSSGDLGADLSTQVQGGHIRSWTSNDQVFVTLTSGTGNLGNGSATNLSAGSTTVYIITETLQ